MKETVVPIDKAGRLVLPKEVREDLAISPGDLLKISVQGNDVILSPRRGKAGLVRKGRSLVFTCGLDQCLDRGVVEAVLTEAREEGISSAASALRPRKRR